MAAYKTFLAKPRIIVNMEESQETTIGGCEGRGCEYKTAENDQ